jgi:hypothetical protein
MITKTVINPIEIKLVNEKKIRNLVFKPKYVKLIQESDMNWISKLFKMILPYIPFKVLGNILLTWFEELTLKTENKWDDTALLSLWYVLYTLGFADEPPESLKNRCKPILEEELKK